MLRQLLRLLGAPPSSLDESSIERDAAKIMSEGNRAVAAIKARLEGVASGRSLFVLVGEDHAVVNHMIYQIYVMEEVRAASIAFAVALEYPSNTIEVYCSKEMGIARREARSVVEVELSNNPTSHPLLYSAAFLANTPFAPHSTATLINYLSEHQIPICFADAAVGEEGNLDRSDPDTESALREAQLQTGIIAEDDVAFDDKLGMVARNIHIQRASFKLSERLDHIPLVFVLVGNAHVLGTEEWKALATAIEL